MKTSKRRLPQLRTVVIGAAVLGLGVSTGVYTGLRATWGTKHPQVKEGVAIRANDENDLVMFDANDGTQLSLYAHSVSWESGNTGGHGDPPCLREPGQKVHVEVGVMWVAVPQGGARQIGLWLTCL